MEYDAEGDFRDIYNSLKIFIVSKLWESIYQQKFVNSMIDLEKKQIDLLKTRFIPFDFTLCIKQML